MTGAATYPDGYGTQTPAFGCADLECDFATDDAADAEAHEAEHDDPCPRCGGDHDRIDSREPCPLTPDEIARLESAAGFDQASDDRGAGAE